MNNIGQAIILIAFLIILYFVFCRKPKIKSVKTPTTKQIKRQRKKARRIRKIKRWFRLPHKGQAEIEEFDPKRKYIESIWNEISKH